MHEQDYLLENIVIIFDKEAENFTETFSFLYITEPDRQDGNWEKSKERTYIQWETYTTLKKLYKKIENSPSDKKTFIAILMNEIIDCEEVYRQRERSHRYHNAASLAFYFLLNIGKYEEIIYSLHALKEKDLVSLEGFFIDILYFMNFEPTKFNVPVLNALANLNFATAGTVREQFLSKVKDIKYSKLKDDLNGINEELNIDKEKAIEIISKYGFSQNLEIFLLEIDNVSQYADWQTGSSALIGNLRSFFEELIKNMAEKIKDKTHEDYPIFPDNPDIKEMGKLRHYLKIHLDLSEKDNKLITSYIDILIKEGAHSFLSERKYFDMTKNIGIEIAYFLLSKYEEFLDKN